MKTWRESAQVIIAFFLWWTVMPVVSAQVVQEVRIDWRDRVRMDEAVVRSHISVKAGDTFSFEAIARDVQAMKNSGVFSYVAADRVSVTGGVAVVYIVELKPRIRKLTIEGAQYTNNRKIRELMELGSGDPVDDAVLAGKSRAVKEFYRKKLYPFVELSWTIDVEPGSGVADVTIRVTEGQRAKIKKISFTGNENITARELRKVMQQKKRRWWSWLTGGGTYDPDLLSADRVLLRRAYTAKGFLDAKIGEPELRDLGEGRVEVVVPVEEGPEYLMGQVSLAGVKLFPVDEVMRSVTNNPGDVASSDALQQMTLNVRDYFGSRGYIETDVKYKLETDNQASKQQGQPVVNVLLSVKEGKLAYIRQIRFRGNTKSRDKVMRREIAVYPGEIYNEVKVRNSENRLRNLGFYSMVSSTPEPTDEPDKFNVVFDLVEQNTGQFLVGAGFSSIDNLIAYVEVQQGNFDFRNWPPEGAGQKLRLGANYGSKRNDYEISLTEPWFLDRRMSLGGALFHKEARYYSDEYEQRNAGGSLTLGLPVARNTRMNFIYGLESIKVYNVDEDASERIKEEEGDRIKSSFTTELIYDSRDSVFVATRGTRATLSGMVAGGPLQGETDIYRVDANISQFIPLWFDHVLNLRGMIAGTDRYGDSDRVPIFDRLYLGGARTLRGFKFRDVGPKDELGEPLGGYSSWLAVAEYTVPVAPIVRLAAFFDIGMVYDQPFDYEFSDYNSDAGVGVRFDIRMFPIRFDYAWPLEADEFNDRKSGRFQFSIGYSF